MLRNLKRVAAILRKALDLTNEWDNPKTKFSNEEFNDLKQQVDLVLYPKWLRTPSDSKKEVEDEIQSAVYPYFFHLAMKIFTNSAYQRKILIDTPMRGEETFQVDPSEIHKYMKHYNAEEVADKAAVEMVVKLPQIIRDFNGNGSLLAYMTQQFKGPKGTLEGILGGKFQSQQRLDNKENLSVEDQMSASNRFEDYTNMEVGGSGEQNNGNIETFGERDVTEDMDTETFAVNAPVQFVAYLDDMVQEQSEYAEIVQKNHDRTVARVQKRYDEIVNLFQQGVKGDTRMLSEAIYQLEVLLANYKFVTAMKYKSPNFYLLLRRNPKNFLSILKNEVSKFVAFSDQDVATFQAAIKAAINAMPELHNLAPEVDFANPGEKEKLFVKYVQSLQKLGLVGIKQAVKQQASSLHSSLVPHLFGASGYGSEDRFIDKLPKPLMNLLSAEDYKALSEGDAESVSLNGKWAMVLAKTAMDSSTIRFTAEEGSSKVIKHFQALLLDNIASAPYLSDQEMEALMSMANNVSKETIATLRGYGFFAPAVAATNKFRDEKEEELRAKAEQLAKSDPNVTTEMVAEMDPQELQDYLRTTLYSTPGYRGLGAINGIAYQLRKGKWTHNPDVVELDPDEPSNIDQWLSDYTRNLEKSKTDKRRSPKPFTMFDTRYKHRLGREKQLPSWLQTFQEAEKAGGTLPFHKRTQGDEYGTDEPPTTASQMYRRIHAYTSILSRRSAKLDRLGFGYIAEAIDDILADAIKEI